MRQAYVHKAKPAQAADSFVRGAPARSTTPLRFGVLQRKCACGGEAGFSDECAECEARNNAVLQRRGAGRSDLATAPPIVHDVLRSPGQPLDDPTRAFMEPRFGHDFSKVRVHADASAAESAQAVGALAYTVGRHVVFRAGRYAPSTGAGRKLLAHELTHVTQQGERGIPSRLAIGPLGGRHEQEAEMAALDATEMRSALSGPSEVKLQRAAAETDTMDVGQGLESANLLQAAVPPCGPAPIPCTVCQNGGNVLWARDCGSLPYIWVNSTGEHECLSQVNLHTEDPNCPDPKRQASQRARDAAIMNKVNPPPKRPWWKRLLGIR